MTELDPIHQRLEELLASSDMRAYRRRDPVQWVHAYRDKVDREVVGLLASLLAFGNAQVAIASVERLLRALGDRPGERVCEAKLPELRTSLDGFVHRIYRGEHLAVLLGRAGRLIRRHGSLGAAFEHFYVRSDGDFREALASFADALRGPSGDRCLRHLVSDPRAGSACKRLLLYARWMIRPADGVDLGLWPIPASALLIPVDTHVHRISRNLGFTVRKTASWAAAEDITRVLRRFDPADPAKYDFAICHLGVSRQCPSRPDAQKCASCVMRTVCSVWARS